jgi:hypothetical protein
MEEKRKVGFYEKAPVTYVREACSREKYTMDHFIGVGSYYIITFIYVTTSEQYERTESEKFT